MYDYIIVGSGLYGSIFARQATDKGYRVLVLEKRDHIGGNIYTENINNINVHKYGAHIFHTNNKEVWDYVNKYISFNNYIHTVKAIYKDKIYDLPFNMNTYKQMWNIEDIEEIKNKINEQKKEITSEPTNLEEQAISLVGRDIYEKLIKGYTEKQWGRDCKDLPSFIIKRLPIRFTFDNSYFDAIYQGIPIGGYTKLIENLLDGIEVRLNTDYLTNKEEYNKLAKKIVYTGPIDAYFNYELGYLEYRSVRFETEELNISNYQDNAVINYTDINIPYTRIIEHKLFEPDKDIPITIISKEYSSEWKLNDEPYYPINDEKNNNLYNQYKLLADKLDNIIFGGRLGEYKYYDMDQVVERVLEVCKAVL